MARANLPGPGRGLKDSGTLGLGEDQLVAIGIVFAVTLAAVLSLLALADLYQRRKWHFLGVVAVDVRAPRGSGST